MRRTRVTPSTVLRSGVFVAILVVAGCRAQNSTPALHELQRAKSGNVDVVLLSSGDALKQGKDQAVVEFRSASDQQPLDVRNVKVNATMPMAGMPPMIGSTTVQSAGTAGRYLVATDLSMSGSWRIGIEWDGPDGHRSVSFSGTVR